MPAAPVGTVNFPLEELMPPLAKSLWDKLLESYVIVWVFFPCHIFWYAQVETKKTITVQFKLIL